MWSLQPKPAIAIYIIFLVLHFLYKLYTITFYYSVVLYKRIINTTLYQQII
jgi:hypothetical protein